MRPSLDDLRARRPDLALALFAMEPGGAVTLEIYDGGQVYSFKGETEADAILAAFPAGEEEQAPGLGVVQTDPPLPDRSIFD